MGKFAERLPKRPLRIADVGSCDVSGTYKPLFDRPGWVYSGLDAAPGKNVDIVLAGEDVWSNVPDGSFDVVVSGQTLEHVRHPWLFARELARITAGGGLLCVIAPFGWVYHAYPIDCWRILADGMDALLKYVGLTVVKAYMLPLHSALQGDTVGIAVKGPMTEEAKVFL